MSVGRDIVAGACRGFPLVPLALEVGVLTFEEGVEIPELGLQAAHHRDNLARIGGAERALKLLALLVEIPKLSFERAAGSSLCAPFGGRLRDKTGDGVG